MKVSLILTCAGKGERACFDKNKLLVKINGLTTVERSLSPFVKSGLIDEYIVTSSKCDFDEISSLLPDYVKVVLGGDTRTQSVKNALNEVSGDIVLIHDGARPNLNQRIIKDCINTANKFGSAITAVQSRDTIAKGNFNEIDSYLGKDGLYVIQTPQAFKTEEIKKAYTLSGNKSFNDDGEVYKAFIKDPEIVNGDYSNLKLTYKEDFDLLKTVQGVKVGTGFDCHKLVENRKLILGGIEIPHDKGLLGHSDADVLTHAIMDALLSGAGLRDIGYYFPDTDEKYRGADSIELLREVLKLIKEKGYNVNNVSAVIMAQKPKLLKHIPAICQNLSSVLNVSIDNVGIGATTLEGLGFVGREEGICVSASATLIKN